MIFLEKISPTLRIVGSARIGPKWVEAMRYIYEHELVLFGESDFELLIEGERIPCPAGSFAIVPPGRRHTSYAVGGRSGVRRWIHFDWVHTGDETQRPVITYCPAPCRFRDVHAAPEWLPAGVMHGRIARPALALEHFRRIDDRFNSGGSRERLAARAALLELLVELLAGDLPEGPENERRAALASRVRRRLDLVAEEPASRAEPIRRALESCGESYAHLCREFKQHYGITPSRYVSESRLARARQLLADTGCRVAEVAALLGYDNVGYFTRLFRRSAGVTPTGYRGR